MKTSFPFALLSLGASLLSGWIPSQLRAADTGATNEFVLYSTGFEVSEGYIITPTAGFDNTGGWKMKGSGGHGFVSNWFEGLGQQGIIGLDPPIGTNNYLYVWHPIDYIYHTNESGLLQFSVMMDIEDSANQRHDEFRWVAYGTNGMRLFGLRFNTEDYHIYYSLDNGAGYFKTGWDFKTNALYTLKVDMDFPNNRWNAYMGESLIVTNQPITTKGPATNLGDMDAFWLIHNPGQPGNGYMLFDNYRIVLLPKPATAETPRPTLRAPKYLANSQFAFQVAGETNRHYVIESSTNLIQWIILSTNSVSATGTYEFMDTPGSLRACYYRVRSIE